MPFRRLIKKVGGAALFRRRAEAIVSFLLSESKRFPYGLFFFKATLPQGSSYAILASPDLSHWNPLVTGVAAGPAIEYLDSDVAKFSARFYRVVVGDLLLENAV